ncbi:hypothetical protein [Clostridium sp. AM58-1XD]|uniref:hypothetical protein n=1 Tax=Clostridium sp. AM58-1XD TaxID=2292307 RepID=UPI000E493EDF|nr:hypothetical protein [Clostridium sp. AM58-1XD]RGY99852.1 hypothetical protein DXA13_06460 [Clostridium sp. AM58-1XD]
MKKRTYVIAAASALALALTACGGGNTKEETTTAVETTAESSAEDATDAVSQESTNDSSEAAEETTEAKKAEVTEDDIIAFVEEVEDAVMNKNMKSLAEMITYPVYVASVKENEGIVADKEAFLALDKNTLFAEAFVDAVTSFNASEIEESEAGYVIGNGTPNVTFNIGEDGALGITGINNK